MNRASSCPHVVLVARIAGRLAEHLRRRRRRRHQPVCDGDDGESSGGVCRRHAEGLRVSATAAAAAAAAPRGQHGVQQRAGEHHQR